VAGRAAPPRACLLREWRDEDIEPFAMMSADIRRVMRYLAFARPRRAAAKEWVGRMRDHWDRHGFGQCVVELPGEASFIGVIGLNHVRWILPFTAGGRGRLAPGAALLGARLCPGGRTRRDR